MKILDQFPNIETHHNLPRACCVLPRYFSMVGKLSFFHATDRVRLPFALVDVLGPYTIPVTCDLPGRRTGPMCRNAEWFFDVSVPISGMVKTGWWFGTMEFDMFPNRNWMMIQSDELHHVSGG